MALKAILLDFDGVIAETDNHHIAAWQRTLSVLGWQVTDEVAARSAEIDDREFLTELFATRGIVSDKIDDWVRRKQVLTASMLKNSPRLYPGVVDLIRKLRGRVRLAVVSGTCRENIQTVLAEPHDPKLAPASVDLVFVCNTLRHIFDRPEYYPLLAQALKPGGRLVNIDFHKRELPLGPPVEHKIAKKDVVKEVKPAGFRLVKEFSFLKYQYFLMFER